MVGARLKGLELLKAWLAVILLTLLAVLVNMGGVWLNYLKETVGRAALIDEAAVLCLLPLQPSESPHA